MSARALAWSVRAALAIPFVVALVALAGSHWSPVLDLEIIARTIWVIVTRRV